MSFTVNTLRTVATSCQQMRDHIKTVVFRPDAHKKLDITFGPTQAAALLGRTPEAIAKAEAKGRLPQPKQLGNRSEEHTSELQSLMRSSYGVFCLKTNRCKRKSTRTQSRH